MTTFSHLLYVLYYQDYTQANFTIQTHHGSGMEYGLERAKNTA